jgi:putative membrane protein
MQFFRTLFWVVVAVAIALFCKANWDIAPSNDGRVPVKLWADLILHIRLPALIVAAFLLGLLPMWGFARIARWRIRRRLESAEQALAASVAAPVSTPTYSTAAVQTPPPAQPDSDGTLSQP